MVAIIIIIKITRSNITDEVKLTELVSHKLYPNMEVVFKYLGEASRIIKPNSKHCSRTLFIHTITTINID